VCSAAQSYSYRTFICFILSISFICCTVITFIHYFYPLHSRITFIVFCIIISGSTPAVSAGQSPVKNSIDTRAHSKLHASLMTAFHTHLHMSVALHTRVSRTPAALGCDQATHKRHSRAIALPLLLSRALIIIHRHNYCRCSQRSHSPNCVQANSAPSCPVPSVGDSFAAFPKYWKRSEHGTVCAQQKLFGHWLYARRAMLPSISRTSS